MTEINSLNDDEMTELDRLLQANDDFLLVDEAHGYLTALIISDAPQLADEAWLRSILGDSAENVEPRLQTLLLRLREEVTSILKSSNIFEPLIAEIEEDGETLESYEGWCFGFMMAISEDEQAWADLPQNVQELIMPIARIALLQEDEDVEMDEEEYDTLVDLIPGSVGSLYHHFRSG